MENFEEINVLQSIYDNEFKISNTIPKWYGMMLSSENDDSYNNSSNFNELDNGRSIEPQFIQILFNTPLGYPSIPLEIKLVNLFSNDIDPDNYCELERILKDRARELSSQEEPAMYEIIELARNWLWNYRPQQQQDNQQSSPPSSSSTQKKNYSPQKFSSSNWWIGEWLDRLFDWQINSYSPSQIINIEFNSENQLIKNIEEECGVKAEIAKVRNYLRTNQWNVENSMQIIKDIKDIQKESKGNIENDKKRMCKICLDQCSEFTEFLPCDHIICENCLIQYLSIKISENQIFSINCPGGLRCQTLVDPLTIGRSLSVQLINKYYSCLHDSFIQLYQNTEIHKNKISTIKKFSWCINPRCNNSISFKVPSSSSCSSFAPSTSTLSTTSSSLLHCYGCKTTWCSSCEFIGGHWPASCLDHETYLRTNQTVKISKKTSSSLTEIFTKPCPKCRIPISKNGGCMHMICGICNYQFCWGCLVEWAKRSHTTFFACDKLLNEDEDDYYDAGDNDDFVRYRAFDLDDILNSPGQLQKKFKNGVIMHSTLLKRERMKLLKTYDVNNIINSNNNNDNSHHNINKLRIETMRLLIQLNYVLKFSSMGLFNKSDKLEIKSGVEILQRLEFGLQSLEGIRDQIVAFEFTNDSSKTSNNDNEKCEKRIREFQIDLERCKERLEVNIKNIVKVLNKL